MIKVLKVDTSKIYNWKSFHKYFSKLLGFFEGYGENMNAWIDCMTSIDEPPSGMSDLTINKGDVLVLHLHKVDDFKSRCPQIFHALVDCTAFVNARRMEVGQLPVLSLSYGVN